MARHHRPLGPIAPASGPNSAPASGQAGTPTPAEETGATPNLAPQPTPVAIRPIPTPISEPPSSPESTPPSEPPSSPESSEPPPISEPPESPESSEEPPSSPESSEEPPSSPESSEEPPESSEPPPISEPPESPEPPAGPPVGYKLFFEDDFDEGSLANFVQGDDNTGSVTVDETAGTATITLPEGVSQPREELSINSSRQHFVEGQQFVLELERWLSPNTAPAGPGDHFTIAQFKGDAGRFPMISEEFGNYNNQGNGLYVQDKNRSTNASFRVADYGLGEWHTDRMYVLVSNTGLGAYTVSADGKQVASATGVNTLEPVDSYGFLKIGAYGQPQGRAVEMKLRNIRVYVPE